MDCPKCDGEKENELQHSYFKADEVVDFSHCLNCGFKFYQVYRKYGSGGTGMNIPEHERYTNDMKSPTKEMSQTEYRLPYYSSTSVVYPSSYRIILAHEWVILSLVPEFTNYL